MDVNYTTDDSVESIIKANATTYVFVTMNRDVTRTYAVYGFDSNPSEDPWNDDKGFPAGSIP
jgi:hypothetical protein